MTGSSEQDLRAVSDALLSDLDLLASLEEQKRLMSPEDPRANQIAIEVTEIARRVLSHSVKEEHITRGALEAASHDEDDEPPHSIEETPRPMHAVLEDWRAAERRVTAATAGSPEQAAAALESERLRLEYQRGYAQRQREQEHS